MIKSRYHKNCTYHIYEDNTYRCTDWDEGDYSEWRIINGVFDIRHAGQEKWADLHNQDGASQVFDNVELVTQVELALAIKQMVEE